MIDLDQTREFGDRFASHLCEAWGRLPDDPEAQDLGNRVAYALNHAVVGTRTSFESLASTLVNAPWYERPHQVFEKALSDFRAALVAADPTVSDDVLAALTLPNPYPESMR